MPEISKGTLTITAIKVQIVEGKADLWEIAENKDIKWG